MDDTNNTNTNTYNVVVVASDDALGAGTDDDPIKMGYKKVEVEVTDVDEPGVVTLLSLQPQVGQPLTAELSDPAEANPTVTWKWESFHVQEWGMASYPGSTCCHLYACPRIG